MSIEECTSVYDAVWPVLWVLVLIIVAASFWLGHYSHGAAKRADEELKKYEAAQKEHDASI